MFNKPLLIILLFSFFLVLSPNALAQDIKNDSITTSFRKGRWLIGLSGVIGSSSTENKSFNETSISNRYGIGISMSNFIKNRLSIGFTTNMERKNIESHTGNLRTTENIFIGPIGSYYLSKSEVGSLFFSLSPGFVLYRDEIGIIQEDNFIENIDKGAGFGTHLTLGYAYIIYDRIAFNLGLIWGVSWIDVESKSLPSENINNANITISDLNFSFGFNILVD